MNSYEHVTHPFPPMYDADSRLLILGSFPSVKSREQEFYYGHPQNRFWKVLAAIFGEREPEDIVTKKKLLLSHGVALWDVIESCDIIGSSDSSIKNAQPTDLGALLGKTKVERIYCNGKLAGKLYEKYQYKATGLAAITLPSTSPANAAYSLERLIEEWRVIK